jgi:hypothetical protein
MKKTLKQVDSGLTYAGANMRLDVYLGMWMETIKTNRRQKTLLQYQGLLRRYIHPRLALTACVIFTRFRLSVTSTS